MRILKDVNNNSGTDKSRDMRKNNINKNNNDNNLTKSFLPIMWNEKISLKIQISNSTNLKIKFKSFTLNVIQNKN